MDQEWTWTRSGPELDNTFEVVDERLLVGRHRGGRDVDLVLGKCSRAGTDPLVLNLVQDFLSRLKRRF